MGKIAYLYNPDAANDITKSAQSAMRQLMVENNMITGTKVELTKRSPHGRREGSTAEVDSTTDLNHVRIKYDKNGAYETVHSSYLKLC